MNQILQLLGLKSSRLRADGGYKVPSRLKGNVLTSWSWVFEKMIMKCYEGLIEYEKVKCSEIL